MVWLILLMITFVRGHSHQISQQNMIYDDPVMSVHLTVTERLHNLFRALVIWVLAMKQYIIDLLFFGFLGWKQLQAIFHWAFSLIEGVDNRWLQLVQEFQKQMLCLEGTDSFEWILTLNNSVEVSLLENRVRKDNLQYFHEIVLI